jgi:hypothetical protein
MKNIIIVLTYYAVRMKNFKNSFAIFMEFKYMCDYNTTKPTNTALKPLYNCKY